jgi:hypothetical protein
MVIYGDGTTGLNAPYLLTGRLDSSGFGEKAKGTISASGCLFENQTCAAE